MRGAGLERALYARVWGCWPGVWTHNAEITRLHEPCLTLPPKASSLAARLKLREAWGGEEGRQ